MRGYLDRIGGYKKRRFSSHQAGDHYQSVYPHTLLAARFGAKSGYCGESNYCSRSRPRSNYWDEQFFGPESSCCKSNCYRPGRCSCSEPLERIIKGRMRLWRITDRFGRHVGYLYGCFHGRDLMTDRQFSYLCSSQQLFLEHDYLTLPCHHHNFVRRTFPDPSDEWRLDKEFHRLGRKIVGLDRFNEFPVEEDRYERCAKKNRCLLRERNNEMYKKINRGLYDFNEMRLTDLELFGEMKQFLSTRERKWFRFIMEGISRGTVTIAVGLGHIYPLACRLRQMGYNVSYVETRY